MSVYTTPLRRLWPDDSEPDPTIRQGTVTVSFPMPYAVEANMGHVRGKVTRKSCPLCRLAALARQAQASQSKAARSTRLAAGPSNGRSHGRRSIRWEDTMTRKAIAAERTTASRVSVEARLNRSGVGGTTYPVANDPRHTKAWREVSTQRADWAEVRDGDYVAFRAWRVTANSWAWMSSAMAAPAFAEYTMTPEESAAEDRAAYNALLRREAAARAIGGI